MHNQLLEQSTDARQEAGIFLPQNNADRPTRIERMVSLLRSVSADSTHGRRGLVVFSLGPEFEEDAEFLKDNFDIQDIQTEVLPVHLSALRVGEVSEARVVIDFYKKFPAGLPPAYESRHFKRVSNTVRKSSLLILSAPLSNFAQINYIPE